MSDEAITPAPTDSPAGRLDALWEQGERPDVGQFLAGLGPLPPARMTEVAARHAEGSTAGGVEGHGPARVRAVSGYAIVGEMGRGGMGGAYKAWHVALTRHVALKMIRAGHDATPQELARFK